MTQSEETPLTAGLHPSSALHRAAANLITSQQKHNTLLQQRYYKHTLDCDFTDWVPPLLTGKYNFII